MNASTKPRMGRARNTLRASLTALSLCLMAAPALARTHDQAFVTGASFAPDCPNARTLQRGGVSLSQATAIAQSRVPGRVVRAETVMMGDRVVHEIRILGNDGRVRTVRVDAQTGAVM